MSTPSTTPVGAPAFPRGELTVTSSDARKGTLFFRDGQVVHAEFEKELGLAAAQALLRVKTGTFRFSSKPIALARATLGGPLASLRSGGGI